MWALPQFEALRQQLKATAADLVARLRELGCTVTSAAVTSPAKPSAEQPAGSQLKLRSYQVQPAVYAARRMLVLTGSFQSCVALRTVEQFQAVYAECIPGLC